MEAYSLYEVNQYIRRVIALNFEEAIWVECEINQLSRNRSNTYLELIEKNPENDDIIAKSSATLWYRQFLFIKKKLGKLADDVLSAGIKVKLKCTVEFSERYGLSLNILDIDPSYTFGQFELNRQKIIERLQAEDLLELNSQKKLPSVIKRIAVISSSTAAGYQDFTQHLLNNNYGYGFNTRLFQAAMQGQNTEREVVYALDSIASGYYDLVCIIRGGGSKLDLSGFDNYAIASAIAQFPIPVLTGIGHEIDQTICDIVAHTSLKTPTAVAHFIIDHNLGFETEIENTWLDLIDAAESILAGTRHNLQGIQSDIVNIPRIRIQKRRSELDFLSRNAADQALSLLSKRKTALDAIEKMTALVSPEKILKRGFALVKTDAQYITNTRELLDKKEIIIEFSDGESKVNIEPWQKK